MAPWKSTFPTVNPSVGMSGRARHFPGVSQAEDETRGVRHEKEEDEHEHEKKPGWRSAARDELGFPIRWPPPPPPV